MGQSKGDEHHHSRSPHTQSRGLGEKHSVEVSRKRRASPPHSRHQSRSCSSSPRIRQFGPHLEDYSTSRGVGEKHSVESSHKRRASQAQSSAELRSRRQSPPKRDVSPRRDERNRRRSRSRSYDRFRHFGSSYGGYRHCMDGRDNPVPCRCLGVFGMSLYTTERDLKFLFGQYGEVESVKIIYDRFSGRSRGFGFVYFTNTKDAQRAKAHLTDAWIDGISVRVDYSVTLDGGPFRHNRRNNYNNGRSRSRSR